MSEAATPPCPPVLVVMGVSGSGKTTVGRALAATLGWHYREGDEFHPQANIEKMREGVPLDDSDRMPWLATIARWMDTQSRAAEPAVIGCSALKRRYRNFLRDGRPQVWFVYLRVPRPILERRMEMRHHPYMPPSLLDSQLATLEEPQATEPRTIAVDAGATVEATLAIAMRALDSHGVLSSTGVEKTSPLARNPWAQGGA